MKKKQEEKRVIYYSDELNDEFSEMQIKAIPIDQNYDYGKSGFCWNAKRFFWYRIFSMPIAWLWLKLKYRHKIVNRAVMKKAPKGPLYIFGNHTNPIADALIPTFVAFPKGVYVIVHANNVSIPGLGLKTRILGALPLPDNLGAAKNFMNILKVRAEEKQAVCVYPEAHIWPYYTKIRPFSDLSFRYPMQFKAAVYCFTNTYQKRRFSKNPRMVTYVDGPFYADGNLPSKEARLDLRNRVYEAMTKRSQNSDIEIIQYIKKEKSDD
ncbi:MAG: 1-acyl-sn-glycerol-3-phosphate acyltransferase [Treponema sp.]|nr:1-acyl-sn-glycerol-3-phosphate acyltransferase [Treponema sp.]